VGDFKNGGRELRPKGDPEEVRVHDFKIPELGKARYPQARQLLITADCGGSNGVRVRLWKLELQKLADELQIAITVAHLPPGTSKWNRIEHRLFAFITQNWRGKPLVSHQVIVQLISATATSTGLDVACRIDDNLYPKGVAVSDQEIDAISLTCDKFHGVAVTRFRMRANTRRAMI
jgi:hypothetical protein